MSLTRNRFETSFNVAAYKSSSSSGSPDDETDWRMPSLPRSDTFLFLWQRPLPFGRSHWLSCIATYWGLSADQQGFDPPPAIYLRCQEQGYTNWATASLYKIGHLPELFARHGRGVEDAGLRQHSGEIKTDWKLLHQWGVFMSHVSHRQATFWTTTSPRLPDNPSFKICSSAPRSRARLTCLLILTILSIATILGSRHLDTTSEISSGKNECILVGWPILVASATNSSGLWCAPALRVPSWSELAAIPRWKEPSCMELGGNGLPAECLRMDLGEAVAQLV